MRRLRGKLTYANVISTLCLFLLLGGGAAFAATKLKLGKNSVGTKQIKKEAVTPVKLSKAAKSTLTGAPGKEGPKGAKGERGEPGPLVETLPSGKTERGMYVFNGTASTAGGAYTPNTSISYPLPLTFTPTANFIKKGGSSTTQCPGTTSAPTAAPGNLCVYEDRDDNGFTTGVDLESETPHFGALLYVEPTAGSNYEIEGTYAVTAP